MCPKWGHIICQLHSGAAQGRGDNDDDDDDDRETPSSKPKRGTRFFCGLKKCLPYTQGVNGVCGSHQFEGEGEGEGTRQSNVVIMYYLFLFIVYYSRPARGPKHRMSPGNFTDLSLINFRKLFALSLSVALPVALSLSRPFRSGQVVSGQAVKPPVETHQYH